MSLNQDVWCVAWLDREAPGPSTKRPVVWCATKGGRSPSEAAWSDETRCGYAIILRCGSARRTPTCPDCIKKMEKKPRAATRKAGK